MRGFMETRNLSPVKVNEESSSARFGIGECKAYLQHHHYICKILILKSQWSCAHLCLFIISPLSKYKFPSNRNNPYKLFSVPITPLPMAKKKRPKAQSKYFYPGAWRKDEDTAFINCLYWEALQGNSQANPMRPNHHSLAFAKQVLDVYSDRTRPNEFYLGKLHLLRRRYHAFKRIMDDLDLVWNASTNRVISHRDDWQRLFQEDPFTKAYRYRGEAKWEQLSLIFGTPDNDHEDTDDESMAINIEDEDSDTIGSPSDCVFLGIASPKHDVVDLCSSDSDFGAS
ncbi:hypothetical protein Salat_1100300 [Sesamum alatum]|uniref:Myb/SANT-like domain-containing protein n=1 Tax=Sesamum alatum TaxID=300844 RepID=A0AAE1YMX3_9LAMI|nr:hypothetical protein Salat_1100300 [Sesamum alatum]